MNKTLVVSAIVLVAVIMGIGAVVPMIPQAEAAHAATACMKTKALFDDGKISQKAWDQLKVKLCHR